MIIQSEVPVFYDCEASCLGGLPIEIGWAFIDMATGQMGVPRARICTLPKDFRTYSGTI
jgi:hypothetical protein